MSEEVVSIAIKAIRPGPNHRTRFDQAKLQELATSLTERGLIQPITVRPIGGMYEIVAGERRFRAAQLAGWVEIKAIVRQLDDEAANAVMLAENTGREDLNPIDEARAYQRTVNQFTWAVTQVAKAAGVSATRVANRIALLALDDTLQEMVVNGQLAIGVGEDLSVLPGWGQRELTHWIAEQPTMPTRRVIRMAIADWQARQAQCALPFQLVPPVVAGALKTGGGHLRGVLPKVAGLPELPNRNGSMGAIVDEYAVALLQAGRQDEARVIVDFWAKLMESNYAVLLPAESKLLGMLAENL